MKKEGSRHYTKQIIFFLALVAGLTVGLVLINRAQDIRNRAAGGASVILSLTPATQDIPLGNSQLYLLNATFTGGAPSETLDYFRTQIEFNPLYLELPTGNYIDTTSSGFDQIFRVDGPQVANQNGKIIIELGSKVHPGPSTDAPVTIAKIYLNGKSLTPGIAMQPLILTQTASQVVDNQSIILPLTLQTSDYRVMPIVISSPTPAYLGTIYRVCPIPNSSGTTGPTPTSIPGVCDYYGPDGIQQALDDIPNGTSEANKNTVLVKSCTSVVCDSSQYAIYSNAHISSGGGVSALHPAKTNVLIKSLGTVVLDNNFNNTTNNSMVLNLNSGVSNINIEGFIIQNGKTAGIFLGSSQNITLKNNLIKNNIVGVDSISSSNHLINNTIANNNYGIIYINGPVASDFINNILYSNSSWGMFGMYDFTNGILKYNDLYGNGKNIILNNSSVTDPVIDISNKLENPLFLDPSNGDFRLDPLSPAKNTGDPSILNQDGSRSDMGAYGGSGALTYVFIPTPTATLTPTITPTIITTPAPTSGPTITPSPTPTSDPNYTLIKCTNAYTSCDNFCKSQNRACGNTIYGQWGMQESEVGYPTQYGLCSQTTSPLGGPYKDQLLSYYCQTISNVYCSCSNALITQTPTPTPTTSVLCPRGELGNLDCSLDGGVDTADFELFRQSYGKSVSSLNIPSNHHTPDLIQDAGGLVDTADYNILYQNFGSYSP